MSEVPHFRPSEVPHFRTQETVTWLHLNSTVTSFRPRADRSTCSCTHLRTQRGAHSHLLRRRASSSMGDFCGFVLGGESTSRK